MDWLSRDGIHAERPRPGTGAAINRYAVQINAKSGLLKARHGAGVEASVGNNRRPAGRSSVRDISALCQQPQVIHGHVLVVLDFAREIQRSYAFWRGNRAIQVGGPEKIELLSALEGYTHCL